MPIYSRFSVCIYLPIQRHLLSPLNSVETYSYLTNFTCGVGGRDTFLRKFTLIATVTTFLGKKMGRAFQYYY